MSNSKINTLLLLLLTLVVTGAGYYLHAVRHPAEMQHIDDMEKTARLQYAEVEQLLVEESQSGELAEEAVRKWRARYKYIPAELKTADIIQYFERLGSDGFEEIRVDLAGVTTRPDFQYYTFNVSGKAFFRSLYAFVWHLENNREFYHVRDLSLKSEVVFKENPETGVDRMLDVVQFSMQVDAFFAGTQGMSASMRDLAQPPEWLMPARVPAHNSFLPLVRTDLPNNDQLLVNVETARLVSILGDRAIVEDERGRHELAVGDDVYLGRITQVDPINVVVIATLNKGGVTEVVELRMDKAAPHEQASGRVRLSPIRNQ